MDFYDHFTLEHENAVQRSKKLLLLGDLNSNTLSSQLPECHLLRSFTSSFGLQDMFTGPTRVTESTSSHLDVFLTNSRYSFTDVMALPVGFSDHHIVLGTYLTRRSHQPSGHKLINVRSYRKLDPALLHTIYSDETWKDVFSFDNVSDTVECFTAMLQSLMDLLIPLHKIRVKQHVTPWAATTNVISARRARDKLHHHALRTGDPDIWQQYRCARNRANKLLRNAKHNYLSQLASSTQGGSKKFWSSFQYMSAGGVTNYNPTTLTSSVEVLHIKEEGWFSGSYWSPVKQLPFRASCLDTLINDEKLYIAGGLDEVNHPLCGILTATLPQLLLSSNKTSSEQVWNKLPDMPYYSVSIIHYQDHLISFSGVRLVEHPGEEKPLAQFVPLIHLYNPNTRCWECVGSIDHPYNLGRLICIKENKILFVGGSTSTHKVSKEDNIVATGATLTITH